MKYFVIVVGSVIIGIFWGCLQNSNRLEISLNIKLGEQPKVIMLKPTKTPTKTVIESEDQQ
jgi:hypothetical protein